MSLSIEEVKQMKHKLEAKIAFEMGAFEVQTGLKITDFDCWRTESIGIGPDKIQRIELEVKF